jgi:sorbitol-6-phosphate 2-dehydrogenase
MNGVVNVRQGALAGKISLVTGGAQGLGQAISWRLAREGSHVVIADINEAGAQTTAEAIARETNQRVIGIKVDITNEPEVRELFERTMQEFHRLDVLIANAGILIAEPIATADADKWRRVIEVNLLGYFLAAKYACGIMSGQRSGSIIEINSKSGLRGSAANSAYAASKFGGIGLTQSIALEMARYNVRCNAICPGNLLESPLWTHPENGLFLQYLRAGKVPGATTIEDVRRHYMNLVPMKRGCTYDDVANAVVFLASDQSTYITGISLSVTGGQEM